MHSWLLGKLGKFLEAKKKDGGDGGGEAATSGAKALGARRQGGGVVRVWLELCPSP